MKNNKKIIIVAIALVVLLAIILVIFGWKNKKQDNKKSLDALLTDVGNNFYENFYYKEDQKASLVDYKDSGFNISITNLNVVLPVDQQILDRLNDHKCNLDNTKILIFPKEPYGKKDYSIKVELACEK